MSGSGNQIKVSQHELDDLQQKLGHSLDVLNGELESSVILAADCGDSVLGAKIIEFGQSWNKHRFDIRDEIQWLHDSVKNIADQLQKVDAELAKSLAAKPPAPQPTLPNLGGTPSRAK